MSAHPPKSKSQDLPPTDGFPSAEQPPVLQALHAASVARKGAKRPSLAHRVAQIVKSIGREQKHTLATQDASAQQDDAMETLFARGVELVGRLLDVHGDAGLDKVRAQFRAMPADDALLAESTLLALGQTAAEESNPAGMGPMLGLDTDPSRVMLFAIPIAFFAKDPSQPHDFPDLQLGAPEHRASWKAISSALRDNNLISEDCFTLLHPFLHEPQKLAQAGLAKARAFARVLLHGVTTSKPCMPLGYDTSAQRTRYALSPVQARCLVGALVVGEPQDTFLDLDPGDDPELVFAIDGLVQTLESELEQVFPNWEVGVLTPRPLFEAAVEACMAIPEYWIVQMVHQALRDHEHLDASDLHAAVALAGHKGAATSAQIALCDPDGTVLAGMTLPLHGLEVLCEPEDLPDMMASMAEQILADRGASNAHNQVACVRAVVEPTFDDHGQELFYSFDRSLRPVARSAQAWSDTSLH